MKRFCLLIVTCCLYTISRGQDAGDNIPNIPEPKPTPQNAVYGPVEIEPSYAGGMVEFYKYLNKNIIYPKKALRKKVQGKVFVQFVVEKDGCLTDIKAIKSPSVELSNECIRVLANCRFMPDSKPERRIKPIYTVPIGFDLANPTKHVQLNAW